MRVVVLPAISVAASSGVAAAQVTGPSAVPSPALSAAAPAAGSSSSSSSSSWEIEGYGGASVGRFLNGGSRTVPPPGPSILTSSPTVPSRQVSSWLFGDGAALLNDVNAEFNAAGRVTPLDAAFAPLSSGVAGAAGVRVRRKLTSRYSAEFSLDVLLGSSAKNLGAAAATTAASAKSALTDLLATGPFTNVSVDSTSSSKAGSGGDLVASGAINMRLGAFGGFAPYVTAGGGVMAGFGALPSVSLSAHYQFAILDTVPVPIDERDTVVLRYAHQTAFVGVAGAGLRREGSGSWGLRIDGRVFIGPNNTRLLLDATPAVVHGAPAGFVESFTAPAIQFSNDPATGRQSTLSGAALNGFAAFAGGIQTRVVVSVGIFKKF